MQVIDQDIERLKGGGTPNVVATIKYIFARDLHIGPRELRTMPLIEVLTLLKMWKKEQKETERRMRRKK